MHADTQMGPKTTNIYDFFGGNILVKNLCLCLEIDDTQPVKMFGDKGHIW